MLVALLTLLLPSVSQGGEPQRLRPGLYDSLMIAVAPDGRVTGHFREQLGSLPVRECSFFLAGRGEAISAWLAGDAASIRGRLVAEGTAVSLMLPEVRDLPGCASVLSPDAAERMVFERSRVEEWTALAVVAAPRAPLYASATAARGRGYIVAGDLVGVSARVGARLRVTYIDAEGQSLRRWVDAVAVKPVMPPD